MSAISDAEQNLDAVLSRRAEIASELREYASFSEGIQKKRAVRLADDIEAGIPSQAAMLRADVLAVAVPVICGGDAQSRASVFAGLRELNAIAPRPTRVLAAVLYPALLFLLSVGVAIIYLLAVIPMFEAMFIEFDLSLPAPTLFIIWVSQLLRQSSVWLAVVALIAVALVWRRLRPNKMKPVWAGEFDIAPWGRRCHAGIWAWHVSLLLRLGLSLVDAISIAGRASDHRSLRTESRKWSMISHDEFSVEGVRRVCGSKCDLLVYAMQWNNRAGRIELLQEVASMYIDRADYRTRALVAWLSPIAMFFVSSSIGLLIMALFMPLVNLISSLG